MSTADDIMATLERHQAGISSIIESVHDLATISRALHRVGMTHLADEIAEIAKGIGNAARSTQRAYDEKQRIELEASKAEFGGVLKTLLDKPFLDEARHGK